MRLLTSSEFSQIKNVCRSTGRTWKSKANEHFISTDVTGINGVHANLKRNTAK